MAFDLSTLETGDIILFRGNSWISYILEWLGRSYYSHVGMIVKNPSFMDSSLPDGIYLLESGWNSIPDSEDHQLKMGVQLHLLSDILKGCTDKSVYVRRVSCQRDVAFYSRLDTIHKAIHNRAYDLNIMDWLRALYHLDIYNDIKPSPHANSKAFWCSALVAYIFDELGLINPVCWTEVVPRDFSLWSSRLEFRCKISGEELIQ
jgi:hypothetical protein